MESLPHRQISPQAANVPLEQKDTTSVILSRPPILSLKTTRRLGKDRGLGGTQFSYWLATRPWEVTPSSESQPLHPVTGESTAEIWESGVTEVKNTHALPSTGSGMEDRKCPSWW